MQHEQGQTTTERYNAFPSLQLASRSRWGGEPIRAPEDYVDSNDTHPGRLLIGDGGFADTVPWAIANLSQAFVRRFVQT